MIPKFWNKTITIYVKDETSKKVQWERVAFSRCFFMHSVSSEFGDNSRNGKETYLARIPCIDAPKITPGCIAVLGNVSDVISDESSGNDIISKYGENAFRINSVKFNTDCLTPHVRIGN